MLRLVSSTKSNDSCLRKVPSDSCLDDRSISCCPWRMPRPGIPAALRTLQLKLRGSTSMTSQSNSEGKRRSLFSLFGKRNSTPVVPFSDGKDHGVSCVQELRASKSVGAVTDHFAKLTVGAVEGRTRSTSTRRSVRHQGTDQGSIKCAFSLPGAVIDNDDEPSDTGDANRRTSFYSEIDTNEAKLGPFAPNKAKPSHDEIICEPECSLDSKLKDNTEKPDMDYCVSPCEDVTPPEDHETSEYHETSRVRISYADEDTLEEEVKFFDKTGKKSDDYVNHDGLLDRCPKSELINNLQMAVTMSKCATRHLGKALKKWPRISRGPFPREPGTHKFKADIIDDETAGLRWETARYLKDMNKVFSKLYRLREDLDDIEERQVRLVDLIRAGMDSPYPPPSP
eukprot:XP_011662135.1 PREDICTED: uncharacterized protein LOC105437343 [Strongylocentrotus purpuratus]